MFEIYKPEYSPYNLTGQVGGSISSQLLSGYLNEVFQHVSAPPSGLETPIYQYRKIFVKNEYPSTATNVRMWVDAIEHPEQIKLSNASGLSDYTSSSTEQPIGVTGWRTTTNYAEGISLGTLNANAYTGVWIRQALSGIDNPDPYATLRIYVGGIV